MKGLRNYRFGGFFGGLHADYSAEIIPNNAFTRSDNFVLRKIGLEKAKGWNKFSNQQLTDGEATPAALTIIGLDEYVLRDGSNYLIVFTNKRPYYFDEVTNLFIPFYPPNYGVSTTVDADSGSGTNTLYVADTAGFSVGDAIIIHRNGSREEIAVIDSINAGASLVLKGNLINTHTAADADSVEKLCQTCTADVSAGDTTITLNDTSDYSAGEEILVGWGTGNAEYMIVTSVDSATQLTVQRPSWAPSGTGFQNSHAGSDYELVVRMASIAHADTSDMSADIFNDRYYFGSEVIEVQGANFTNTIPKSTTSSAIYLCGDMERGDISSNTALRDCEGITTGDLVKGKFIKVFENFVVLANLQEGSNYARQKVRWSRYADPANWRNNADGSGQAGYFTFSTPDDIMGVYQLKRMLIVYRQRSIEAMHYVGYPAVFSFKTVETGTGLIAPGALIDLGDAHVFCGPDNLWQYDGVSLRAIGDPIKETFFDMLNPSKREKIKLFYVEETDDIILAFHTGDAISHDKAFVYNIALNQWSGPVDIISTAFGWYDRRDDISWDETDGDWDDKDTNWDSREFRSNNPLNMMGADNGYIYTLWTDTKKDGDDITAYFETKLTDCGLPMMNKRLLKVRVGFTEIGDYTVNLYIGAADYEGEALSWHGPYQLSVAGNANPFVSVDVRGRFFKVRVEAETDGVVLKDMELFFVSGGWR